MSKRVTITKGLLAFRRATQGLSGAQVVAALAEHGGSFSQSAVWLWMAGQRVPGGDARACIKRAFGIDSDLWSDVVNEEAA